jgi:pimeloyl-ACP methyl ester carboxylesterase
MFKFIAIVTLYLLLYNYYYKIINISNIDILSSINHIFHDAENQEFLSTDTQNIKELFGPYSYITTVYNTTVEPIAITTNIQKQNNNKYILWLNGYGDVFTSPFISKELIKKGYDIYILDYPNVGFAQIDKNNFLNYPSISDLIGYLNATINFIDSNYNNPTRILYGISISSIISLYYIKLYPNIFQKLIINAPTMNYKNKDFSKFFKLSPYIFFNTKNKKNYGMLSKSCLSTVIYDIRPYGTSKKYINYIVSLSKNNKKLKNAHYINRLEKSHGRYLLNEHKFKNTYLYHSYFNYHIFKTIYDIPVLILCSNKYTDSETISLNYSKSDFGLSKLGDIEWDISDIEYTCNIIFKNYRLVKLENASHDVFFSSNDIRKQATKEFINFI